MQTKLPYNSLSSVINVHEQKENEVLLLSLFDYLFCPQLRKENHAVDSEKVFRAQKNVKAE